MIRSGLKARRARIALLVVPAVALAAAGMTACSSSKKATTTATRPAEAGPTITPLPEPPKTPPSLPRIEGDPFNVPLTKVEGGQNNFTLSVPASWEHVSAAGSDTFKIKDGPYQAGQMTVECGEPKSPDLAEPYTSMSLVLQEARPGSGIKHTATIEGIAEIEANGHMGATYRDTRVVGIGAGVSGETVIFAEPDCAWRIVFVYGNTDQAAAWETLFGRVVSTFEPGTKPR